MAEWRDVTADVFGAARPPITCMFYGEYLCFGLSDGAVLVYKCQLADATDGAKSEGRLLRAEQLYHLTPSARSPSPTPDGNVGVTSVSASRNRRYLAIGLSDGTVTVVELLDGDGRQLSYPRGVYSHRLHGGRPVTHLLWGSWSLRLFSACAGGLLACTSLPSGAFNFLKAVRSQKVFRHRGPVVQLDGGVLCGFSPGDGVGAPLDVQAVLAVFGDSGEDDGADGSGHRRLFYFAPPAASRGLVAESRLLLATTVVDDPSLRGDEAQLAAEMKGRLSADSTDAGAATDFGGCFIKSQGSAEVEGTYCARPAGLLWKVDGHGSILAALRPLGRDAEEGDALSDAADSDVDAALAGDARAEGAAGAAGAADGATGESAGEGGDEEDDEVGKGGDDGAGGNAEAPEEGERPFTRIAPVMRVGGGRGSEIAGFAPGLASVTLLDPRQLTRRTLLAGRPPVRDLQAVYFRGAGGGLLLLHEPPRRAPGARPPAPVLGLLAPRGALLCAERAAAEAAAAGAAGAGEGSRGLGLGLGPPEEPDFPNPNPRHPNPSTPRRSPSPEAVPPLSPFDEGAFDPLVTPSLWEDRARELQDRLARVQSQAEASASAASAAAALPAASAAFLASLEGGGSPARAEGAGEGEEGFEALLERTRAALARDPGAVPLPEMAPPSALPCADATSTVVISDSAAWLRRSRPSWGSCPQASQAVISAAAPRAQEAEGEYSVELRAPHGLGLSLGIVGTKVVVRGFNALADGSPSPAQVAGSIGLGDVLVGVNGVLFPRISFEEIVQTLQNLSESARRGPLRLRFRMVSGAPPRGAFDAADVGNDRPFHRHGGAFASKMVEGAVNESMSVASATLSSAFASPLGPPRAAFDPSILEADDDASVDDEEPHNPLDELFEEMIATPLRQSSASPEGTPPEEEPWPQTPDADGRLFYFATSGAEGPEPAAPRPPALEPKALFRDARAPEARGDPPRYLWGTEDPRRYHKANLGLDLDEDTMAQRLNAVAEDVRRLAAHRKRSGDAPLFLSGAARPRGPGVSPAVEAAHPRLGLSLIHITEPTRLTEASRIPSSA